MSDYVAKNLTPPIRVKQAKLLYVLAAILVTVLVISGSFFFKNKAVIQYGIIAIPFFLLLFREAYRRSRRLKIHKRRFSPNKPFAWQVQTTAPYVENMVKHGFSEALKAMQQVKTPLLFLVEKRSEEDHLAYLFDLFIYALQESGIDATRFYHQGDMQFFWNEKHPKNLSIDTILQKYNHYQPVFCGDAHRAVNPATDELQGWTFQYYGWKRRFILTNHSPSLWDYHEEILSMVFSILPFSNAGIRFFAKKLSGQQAAFPIPANKGILPPELYENHPNLITELESHFGKAMTQWIAATALCSKLDWELTLKIGHHLSQGSETLVSFENLLQLSNLEWFRHGTIPEQARQQLGNCLDENTRLDIRRLMISALEENPPIAPSHAHNSYRMELAGLKILIPGFPQKGLKNELYELKSMGYQEDILVTDWINKQKWWLDRLIPKALEKVAYYEGFFLLGRSFWFFIPLLFVFGFAVSRIPDGTVYNGIGKLFPMDNNEQQDLSSDLSNNVTHSYNEPYRMREQDENAEGTVPEHESSNHNEGPGPQIIELQQIKGTVTDVDGDYVSNATVTVSNLGIKQEKPAMGQFALELPERYKAGNNVRLEVNAKGYFPKQITTKAGDKNVKIVLVPMQIEVIVLDEEGESKQKISNAVIIFNHQPWETDQSGEATLNMPPDLDENEKLNFTIEKAGFNRVKTEENISKKIEILLFKTPLISLRGRVSDDKGQPIHNVLIQSDFGQKRTDASGQFSFLIPENQSQLEAHFEHNDFYNKSKILSLHQFNTIQLERKSRTLTLKGKVVNKCTPEPIFNARVLVEGFGTQHTYANGDFRFELNLPQGQNIPLKVDINGNGYHPISKMISSEDLTRHYTFELSPETITGTILDEKKKAIPEAEILLPGEGRFFSDKEGKFQGKISEKFPCTSIIEVKKSGYKSYEKKFQSGGVITLYRNTEKLQLSGIIQDGCTQKPIYNASVKLNGVGSRHSKSKGDFEFEIEITKGITQQYVLEISKTGYHPRTLELSSTNLDKYPKINLTPTSIEGKILEMEGAVVPDAKVRVGSITVYTGDDGKFLVKVPENYNCLSMISVTKNGFEPYNREFQPGSIIRLSRIAPDGTSIIIKTEKKINGKYVAASGVRIVIDGVAQGSTLSEGTRKIILQKKIGEEIKIHIPGSNEYYQQTRTVRLTQQNQIIEFRLSGLE